MIQETLTQEKTWQGTAVSSGVAHAVVHVLKEDFDEPDADPISADEVENELARWHTAMDATHREIEELKEMVSTEERSAEADIFDTHLLILEDVSIRKYVEKTVREKLICVDAVYYRLMCKHMDALRGLADSYLRERFLDIKDITHRVMRHLRGELLQHPMFEDPVIIVAHDLTPSDTVQLDRSKVLGFAIETGSGNSHAAIIARSLGLPAVVRLHGITEELHSGDPILLDGNEGALILNPTPATLSKYRSREQLAEKREDALHETRHEPSITTDGVVIQVCANAEFVEEMGDIRDSGAANVGLFRTEFLYLEDPEGTEDWLAENYTRAVRIMTPGQVIFRTLDIGGDKVDDQLASEAEPNPFLGWRGIRVSLGMREMFKRQLRALLRAAAHGPIGIMFPMVSDVGEVRAAKELLAECASELSAEGYPAPMQVDIGAMIEIPSAALTADLIAAEVDFFSLGTNDLVQYTLAVDRLNERVADLYSPTHPAVLRLIALTVEAARRAGIRVCICGEMAADVEVLPLLIGLGLDELSVSTGQIARVKHAIRKLNASECRSIIDACRHLGCPKQILGMSRTMAQELYPDLFE
ncbi:phosphotransferase system enzyme I (PtsI) [Prosthecobacter fusiformis]|uniref:Phosphoenolpyruvate-protein phosphotransferase n=1 Tax=Prosthecobacter fusiformis TaxID=48464 RepID=A0A4R7RL36_9BACT|nr:phosphoenolpyruvate--protein phosphotransferase [Prosthecobacter fusiformis]TDU64143.1 phosphotransferase system enzyme I (PtsI) [Prosthecobacter fusiformis]